MNIKQRIADTLKNACRHAEEDYVNAMAAWSVAMGEGSELEVKNETLKRQRQIYREYQEAYDTYIQEALDV